MIKAKLSNGDLVIGITKENVDRLQKGMPIAFNLKDMGLEERCVIITYGETEEKLYTGMMDHIDLDKTKIHIS